MTAALFDSHCHLDFEPLYSDMSNIMVEADQAGVKGFVVPGVNPENWPLIADLAGKQSRIMPAYGIHPLFSDVAGDDNYNSLATLAAGAVAIGEIGLDSDCRIPLEIQEIVFREQLQIAISFQLPLLIHCRGAFQRTLLILREENAASVGGIMHGYSGSVEMAHEFIRLGFGISICSTITRSNARKPLEVASQLPFEHLVLESDAPDMPPQRCHGMANRPAWLLDTAVRLAEIRGVTVEDVGRITMENSLRLLRIAALPA